MPSHISLVEPLRPEWPSWMPIFAAALAWTNPTIRRQDSSCSAVYIPVQPGVIRPAGETQTISVITSPAPPSALLPRWTRWKSPGTPSRAEYMSIGETMTRFASSRPPSRNGWNIGGRGSRRVVPPAAGASLHGEANQRSMSATNSGSRSRRLS